MDIKIYVNVKVDFIKYGIKIDGLIIFCSVNVKYFFLFVVYILDVIGKIMKIEGVYV